MSDYFDVPPPNNFTVESEPRRVLWTPDGRAYVRPIGFNPKPVEVKTTPKQKPMRSRKVVR